MPSGRLSEAALTVGQIECSRWCECIAYKECSQRGECQRHEAPLEFNTGPVNKALKEPDSQRDQNQAATILNDNQFRPALPDCFQRNGHVDVFPVPFNLKQEFVAGSTLVDICEDSNTAKHVAIDLLDHVSSF